jgi:hypothetical protein
MCRHARLLNLDMPLQTSVAVVRDMEKGIAACIRSLWCVKASLQHSGSTKMAYMIQDKPPAFYEKLFDQQRPRYRDPRQIPINIKEVAF